MKPQYPVDEPIVSITKPPLKTKSIKWDIGKGFQLADEGSTYIARTTFNNETQLDSIDKYCKVVAWALGNPVVINFEHFDGSKSVMGATPDEFKGEVDVTINAHSQYDAKPRCIQTRVNNDATRLDNLILDRIYDSAYITVAFTLPGDTEEVVLIVHTSMQRSFSSPRSVGGSFREQQSRNYEKCYDIVNQAIANTLLDNFDKTTGIFSYMLMGFNVLPINRKRIEALLRKSGWTHVEFKTEVQYTLLELK